MHSGKVMGIRDLFGGVDLDQAARPLTSTELSALDELVVVGRSIKPTTKPKPSAT
jgi:hypothetical protein